MESKATPLQFNPPVKDKKWMESIVKNITMLCGTSEHEKQKDLLCQRYFDGKIDESSFDYLRKIDDYEMPAHVRHIPIVRQNLNHLISQEVRRAFNFRAYAVDEDTLRFKLKKNAEDFLKIVDKNLEQKFFAMQAQQQMMEQKKQQIEQLMQRQPQNAQEETQIKALQEVYPLLVAEMSMGAKALERETFITKAEIDKLDIYYKFDYCDFVEMKANSLIKYGAKASDIGIAMQKKSGFTDKLVTGKELYFIDLIEGNKYPIFKRLHPFNVYWSGDGDNEWIQDGQWVAIKYRMSPSSLIDWFPNMPAETKKKLENLSTLIDYGNIRTSINNGAIFTDGRGAGLYGGSKLNTGIEAWFVFWKSSREIKIKYTPNKYMPGSHHKHFFDEGESVSFDPKKNESVQTRYINDVYAGVQIGADIFLNLGRRDVQLRNENDYTVSLPVYGLSFNGLDNPYSLIWATKDIQELSNIIHYHRELMLALAGVKGVVMDLAQKPTDMTEKEWLYYRKQGVTFINSLQRSHGRFPTFNQFQTYDDTLSSSIQYLDNILLSLQRLVDEITGVSYQRKGVTVPTDQVGTSKSAVAQSMLTTEVLYFEHDETVRRALEGWINLTKASLEQGDLVSYEAGGGGREIVNIPAGIFKDKFFTIGVENSAKDEEGIENLRQISLQAFARGQMALREVVKVYSIDNLLLLQKTIDDYAEKAEATNAQIEQNKIAGESQAKMEALKFEKEYDKAINDTNAQLKQLDLQIKQAELELKKQELALKDSIEKSKLQIENKKVDQESMVEMNYLAEQNRAARTEELLKSIEMRINAVLEAHDMSNSDRRENKKIEVEDYKAHHAGKVNIKD